MKLTLKAGEALNLLQAIVTAQISVKGSKVAFGLRLAYNVKQLRNIETAFNEEYKKLVEQFGKRDDAGTPIEEEIDTPQGKTRTVTLEDRAGFETACNELLAEMFEIDLKTLTPDILPEIMDPVLVAGLYPILDEDEEE